MIIAYENKLNHSVEKLQQLMDDKGYQLAIHGQIVACLVDLEDYEVVVEIEKLAIEIGLEEI